MDADVAAPASGQLENSTADNYMNAEPIESEIVNAIALRPQLSVAEPMGVDEIVAQVNLIQQVMKRVMKEGEHFGLIPGCGTKKTLLQPGAQKLTMTFRLAPEYDIQEVNLERGHKEYRVICTLKSMGNGSFVGQGVGCCSSMESKYRWRGGTRKCPECGKETIIKGKKEYGGGWLCFQKKGGCGLKWPDGDQSIEGQSIERQENPDPADTFNTVLKMAKKRAFVDATITATAASDIFTQDMEDQLPEAPETRQEPPGGIQVPPDTSKRAGGAAEALHIEADEARRRVSGYTDEQRAELRAHAKEAQKPRPTATEDQRRKLIGLWELEGRDAIHSAHGYFIDCGAILPTESLSDIPLRWVPVTTKEVRELGMHIASGRAIIPSWVTNDTAGSRQPEESPKPEVRSQKPEPADAFTPPPEEAPAPAYVIPEGMGEETGEIQHVTLKEGKSAKGPWSLWGIKVSGVFHNTFDSKIGKAAYDNTGKVVTVIYRETAKGRNIHDIYIDGKGVLA